MSRTSFFLFVALAPAAVAAQNAAGQGLLANPSFELSGMGGAVFSGWNQFGNVGTSSAATHGFKAAVVTGPNTGDWGVSGFWQRFDTEPGERWSASVSGWHTAFQPLTGASRAILNIEWRDATGGLIAYESHVLATAASPLGVAQERSVTSGPAPLGTAATHFLLGVLQGPGDPVPAVYFDQATFEKTGPPSLDDLQWADFPGHRTLTFSGRTWRVKGPGYYHPGPSVFSDAPTATWVDAEGRLHLSVKNVGGSWYSSEVALVEPLGYGDYIFTTMGRVDLLDPHAVLGLFTWQYGRSYDPASLWWNPFNEMDVELSRWGDPSSPLAHFSVQPYDHPGNVRSFDFTCTPDERVSYAFRWLRDRIEFRSWRGGPGNESAGTLLHSWTYTGPHIPRPEQPRVHLNLWQFQGPPATNQEVILDQFTFVPDGMVAAAEESAPFAPAASLRPASPNPFRSGTRIHFQMTAEGPAVIDVFDVSGRLVRTLLSEWLPAGDHQLDWDGIDDSGQPAASAVYLVQLRTDEIVETVRVVHLR
jgi:hypothetical protein